MPGGFAGNSKIAGFLRERNCCATARKDTAVECCSCRACALICSAFWQKGGEQFEASNEDWLTAVLFIRCDDTVSCSFGYGSCAIEELMYMSA